MCVSKTYHTTTFQLLTKTTQTSGGYTHHPTLLTGLGIYHLNFSKTLRYFIILITGFQHFVYIFMVTEGVKNTHRVGEGVCFNVWGETKNRWLRTINSYLDQN